MNDLRPPSRTALLLALATTTPLGFATKFYRGPADWWFNYYAGGALYVMFWMLVVLAVRPSLSVVRVAWGVFAVTSLLETLQLWQPPLLQAFRGTPLGAALIGTTFSAWDFPYYAAGCALGVLLVRQLPRRS